VGYFAEHPKFLPNAVRELDTVFLVRALEGSNVSLFDVAAHASEDDRPTIVEIGMRNLLRNLAAVPRFVEYVKAALLSDLKRNTVQRQRFAERCLEAGPLRASLRRRIEQSEVRLKAERPELYSEYDRLRA